MRSLRDRLLQLGLDAQDDEDTRLRKFLVLVAALTVMPLSIVWGAIYWVAGATSAALIPWVYAGISIASLIAFGLTRSYRWFAATQFAPYMTLPFLLMWTLGGFVTGSAVAIWAILGPLAVLLLGHRRLATVLAIIYALLLVSMAIVPTPAAVALPGWLQHVFFVLNLTAVPFVAWLLVRSFAGGREGSLDAVRKTIRRYLSPDVVAALNSDPRRTDLGGDVLEVSAVFADLGGYSTYAETRSPSEVVDMLNRCFALALPAILEQGGTPTQLAGDAVMAVFGAPRADPDHALRACRAAVAILERTEPSSAGPLPSPRFHIGINSGPALVGNIGSEDYRNFTAIGDAINLASRLQGIAGPGQVVIGPDTAHAVQGTFDLEPLGPVRVKGRREPVAAFQIRLGDEIRHGRRSAG